MVDGWLLRLLGWVSRKIEMVKRIVVVMGCCTFSLKRHAETSFKPVPQWRDSH